jgi:D-alanine-D-alanine ligase
VTGNKIRLALLYGGRSAEHQVSVVSARSVMEALDPDRYEVVPIAITREGRWLLPERGPCELTAPDGTLPEVDEHGTALTLGPGNQRTLRDQGTQGTQGTDLDRGTYVAQGAPGGPIDVVLPILHGPFGEDGTVQGMLELAGLPYVGAGVLASALAMDKAMAKTVCAQAGLPQVPYVVARRGEWEQEPDAVTRRVQDALDWPVFVKPARLGSSIGVSKAADAAALPAAVAEALAHDDKILVEQGVSARELECGVLGVPDDPAVSIVGEIEPAHEFYDFEAKYLEESKLLIPAPVPERVSARVQELARQAFTTLDCEGMARVDFFYDERADEVLLNEVNTIPGFTPKSMFPMLWAATGVPYPALIDRLVQLALDRHRRSAR